MVEPLRPDDVPGLREALVEAWRSGTHEYGGCACLPVVVTDLGGAQSAWATYRKGWHVAVHHESLARSDWSALWDLLERVVSDDAGSRRHHAEGCTLLLHPWAPEPPAEPVGVRV